MGLEAGPPDPDAWIAIASAPVSDAATGASRGIDGVASALETEGIKTTQRHYLIPDRNPRFGQSQGGNNPIRMALLVHQNDVGRARELISNLREQASAQPPISDEELTRQALAAAPDGPVEY